MKRTVTISTLLLSLLLTTTLFASGVSLTGIGARATAMAGAYRAVANDWSAMYWNPAGIAQLEGWHFGLSAEQIKPTAFLTVNQDDAPLEMYHSDERKNFDRTFYIPAFGVVYGTERMSFGLGVYAPFGLGGKWDVLNTAIYNPAYPEADYEDDLQIIDIHPTIAVNLTDKLSLGVGFSYMMADIMIRQPSTTPHPLFLAEDGPTKLIITNVLTPNGLAEDIYKTLLVDQKLDGNGNGYGFNVGLQYKVTDDLTFALSGNWYNDIPMDGIIDAIAYLPKADDASMQTLSSIINPSPLLTDEQKAQLLGSFSGAQITAYDEESGDTDLPLPMTLGGGIAYTGIENLLLALDVSWTSWSAWDIINIEIGDGTTSELKENWEDGIRLSAGFEYSLSESLKMRGGYYSEPSAVPDQTLTVTIPDISRRHAINIGLSYDLGLFDVYGSYERISLGDRKIDTWEADNLAGLYKMNVNNIMAGIGFSF